MKLFLQILLGIITTILVVGFHMAITYIMPYPIDKINVIFAFLITHMLLRRKGTVVWLSFVMHFLIELYSTAPFGTILFSGTIATLIIYWLAESVFTNSTVLVALGLSTIGLIVYRAIYTVFLVASSVVLDTNTGLLQGSIMLVYLWELLFTSILVGILYMAIEFYKTRKIEFV